MTDKNPFTQDNEGSSVKPKKEGGAVSSFFLVLWYIILAILGVGFLAFVALFVVCMV